MLDFVPHLLIGIQFRGMGRKEEHANLGAVRPHELAHGNRPMKRDAIRNQNQGPSLTTQHLLKKRDVAPSTVPKR